MLRTLAGIDILTKMCYNFITGTFGDMAAQKIARK